MNTDATAERLRDHVYRLAGTIGERNVYRPQALHAAEDYITQIWHGLGYTVVPQTYTVKGVRSANLEITRAGSASPEEIILIGAHYDSVIGSPGANDNASGVAALLELSRLFTTVEPARTLRLVAFVNGPHEPCAWLPSSTKSRHSLISGSRAACSMRVRRAGAAITSA